MNSIRNDILNSNILIVDDNARNLMTVTKILEGIGYAHIKSSSNPLTVIDICEEWAPDILLLDIHMPKKSGLEILAEIRENHNFDFLPILVLTADGNVDTRLKALEIGANDYISKPFHPSEIFLRVQNLLQTQRLHQLQNNYLKELVLEKEKHNKELKESEVRHRNLVGLSPNLICIVSKGIITFINTQGAELLQAKSGQDIVGRHLSDFIHPDYQMMCEEDGLTELSTLCERLPLQITTINGKNIDAILAIAEMETNNEGAHILEIVDISERRRTAQAVVDREMHIRSILDNAPNAIMTMTSDGIIETLNPAAEQTFGYSASEIGTLNFKDIIHCDGGADGHEESTACFLDDLGRFKSTKEKEAVGRKKSEEIFDIDVSLAPMQRDGQRRFVGIVRDITEVKKARNKLEFLANNDPVTSLPNSHGIIEKLTLSMTTDSEVEHTGSVLFVQLDRLNRVNDLFGHVIVEHLLVAASQRLKEIVEGKGVVGRWGGGKFIVILQEASEKQQIESFTREIIETIEQSFDIDNNIIQISTSIGVSVYPKDSKDPNILIKNAGMAAFVARHEKIIPCFYYSQEMDAQAAERDMLERELRGALAKNQLSVFYQPKIDLETGKVSGMEALARWIHPDLGFIPPDKFIPIAEETGLIIDIGSWILKTSCAQTKKWIDEGFDIKVAVNLSGRQFDAENLIETVREILHETNLPASNLELEVTESALMSDVDHGKKLLQDLQAEGISIAIDDFGTGYSSLNYLKQIPLNTLKIDQSFIRNVHTDNNDAAIANTIIAMANTLGLKVVAEGIEIREHAHFLSDLKCDLGQGFLYSKALPSAEFREFLKMTLSSAIIAPL